MLTFDTSFRKDHVLPLGKGYALRPSGRHPSSIVIHSTNGQQGSSFAGEAKFLRDSAAVSAHYLVGKAGQITEILAPHTFQAFHAGVALAAFTNARSIGIECHHAVGDDWPQAQLDALTLLVRELMAEFTIAPAMIETHRFVARPVGRKTDPDDLTDTEFELFRDQLTASGGLHTFRVSVAQANVREGPGVHFPVALDGEAVVANGHTFVADKLVLGEPVGNNRMWVHRVDGIGFLHRSVVTKV